MYIIVHNQFFLYAQGKAHLQSCEIDVGLPKRVPLKQKTHPRMPEGTTNTEWQKVSWHRLVAM